MDTKYLSCAETAKLVRTALAQYFPGVKFSVRSKTYSGGASIDVDWTDGPTREEVNKVVDEYEGATFDGMIDLKSYVTHTDPETGQKIHYGADYIFANRTLSKDLFLRTVEKVAKEWGEQPKIEYTREGQPYLGYMDYNVEQHYREALSAAK